MLLYVTLQVESKVKESEGKVEAAEKLAQEAEKNPLPTPEDGMATGPNGTG